MIVAYHSVIGGTSARLSPVQFKKSVLSFKGKDASVFVSYKKKEPKYHPYKSKDDITESNRHTYNK